MALGIAGRRASCSQVSRRELSRVKVPVPGGQPEVSSVASQPYRSKRANGPDWRPQPLAAVALQDLRTQNDGFPARCARITGRHPRE